MILRSWPPAAVYLPSLRSAVNYVRKFASSASPITSARIDFSDSEHPASGKALVWPQRELGPLSDCDARFPLPGLLGIPSTPVPDPCPPRVDPEELFEALPSERHLSVLSLAQIHATEGTTQGEENFSSQPTADTMLECVAHNCPELLRKGFRDLFPGRDLFAGDLTVITLCLHTENDMSAWSEEIEAERDNLILLFMKGAQDICTSLNAAGFWADYIDPASGRPFYGTYTNATLFETDERYRKLGFEITDLGCCKVITHHVWGTRAFVGCLFTEAPLHHDIVKRLRREKT